MEATGNWEMDKGKEDEYGHLAFVEDPETERCYGDPGEDVSELRQPCLLSGPPPEETIRNKKIAKREAKNEKWRRRRQKNDVGLVQ